MKHTTILTAILAALAGGWIIGYGHSRYDNVLSEPESEIDYQSDLREYCQIIKDQADREAQTNKLIMDLRNKLAEIQKDGRHSTIKDDQRLNAVFRLQYGQNRYVIIKSTSGAHDSLYQAYQRDDRIGFGNTPREAVEALIKFLVDDAGIIEKALSGSTLH